MLDGVLSETLPGAYPADVVNGAVTDQSPHPAAFFAATLQKYLVELYSEAFAEVSAELESSFVNEPVIKLSVPTWILYSKAPLIPLQLKTPLVD